VPHERWEEHRPRLPPLSFRQAKDMAGGEHARNSHSSVVNCLKAVYQNASSGFGADFTSSPMDSGNLQYGEITYGGMEPLYGCLNLGKSDVFYDLGSGVGKLVLYVALRGDVARAVGLEVGERRHALADAACKRLADDLLSQKNGGEHAFPQLEAECSGFSVACADISKERYQDASVVVLANLCLDQGVQNRTVNNLLKCPALRRLVSVAPLSPNIRLKNVGVVKVSCTWARVSAWHVYDVVLPPARRVLTQTAATMMAGPPARCPRGPRADSTPALSRHKVLELLHAGLPVAATSSIEKGSQKAPLPGAVAPERRRRSVSHTR